MTNHVGRAIGVSIVGIGLLALVLSSPGGGDATYAGYASAETGINNLGDSAADQMRSLTGDRMPSAKGALESVLSRWGDSSRAAAQAVIEKYGRPDEVSDGQLVWNNTGAFRKTIVYKDEVPHNFPVPHADVIEQFVEYKVPADKHSALARFDGSLRADRTTGLLSSRSSSERDNFAVLNLAHEVVTGKRTPEQARDQLARVAALTLSGKTSPYTQGLLFKSRARDHADMDRPAGSPR